MYPGVDRQAMDVISGGEVARMDWLELLRLSASENSFDPDPAWVVFSVSNASPAGLERSYFSLL